MNPLASGRYQALGLAKKSHRMEPTGAYTKMCCFNILQGVKSYKKVPTLKYHVPETMKIILIHSQQMAIVALAIVIF